MLSVYIYVRKISELVICRCFKAEFLMYMQFEANLSKEKLDINFKFRIVKIRKGAQRQIEILHCRFFSLQEHVPSLYNMCRLAEPKVVYFLPSKTCKASGELLLFSRRLFNRYIKTAKSRRDVSVDERQRRNPIVLCISNYNSIRSDRDEHHFFDD